MRLFRSSLVGVWCCAVIVAAAACRGSSPSKTPATPPPQSPFDVTVDPDVQRGARDAHVPLDDVVATELARVAGALRSPRARVDVVVNSRAAIPEVGVGGFTNPQTGVVTVSVDPQSRIGLDRTLRTWLPITLAHELDHSARVLDGPGYGKTLVRTIVTEGLADNFSRSLHPNDPPVPWDDALSTRQEQDLWQRAQGQPTNLIVHGQWFFGTTGDVPRWAGYTLGARLVATYRAHNPAVSWADVTRLPADRLIAASGYRP